METNYQREMLTSEKKFLQTGGRELILCVVRSFQKADMQMMMFSQKTLENKGQTYPRGLRTIVIAISG